jgi:hypothetical protein
MMKILMPAKTPKQQKLMGADLARARAGKKTVTGAGAKKLAGGGGLPEAPTDGQLYGRKNAAWAPVGGSSAFNDVYYDREDFNDINIVANSASSKNFAGNFNQSPGVNFAPWETGHEGILQMTSGTSSGQNAMIQRNFGFGTPTALDLTKVVKLIYRAVIKIDTLFLTYNGGGEHTWGILSQTNPICGAMFSVAPGFVDTSGATAGQNIITGTYQDASIPLMQDLSRPNFPIAPMTWYDSIMVWTPTEVKFYMRPWSMDGSTPWTLCGTNTQYIGTGVPVYVTRASKCYGDTVSRSLFLDLEELYIDVGTPKRYLGQDLINF